MQKVIAKKDLLRALDGLLKEFEIIGPNQIYGKGIFYQPLRDVGELYLGEGFTTEPVKKFFLSPSEWISSSDFKEGKNSLRDLPLPECRRIIIGVRPCEARGLTLLDKVFDPSINSGSTLSEVERVDSDYKDNFYVNNRKRTIIIGLSCKKPDADCFCTSMDGSPADNVGIDLLLFDAGDGFIAEIITEKAKEIFSSFGNELDKTRSESLEKDKSDKKALLKRKIKVPETLQPIFENDYWRQVSSPCLSCGICTYLCPTCHCFDLVDEERKQLRCYDGCAFRDFTLQTSGENPRPTKKERYRQRVFHKFDYFKRSFNENLCVGCGRCIRFCPVKIDIAEIVDKTPC